MELDKLSRIKGICSLCTVCMLLCACDSGDKTSAVMEETPIFSMGVEMAEFEYAEQKPHLIVSREFSSTEQKVVYADCSMSGQQFSVIDGSTSQEVYTGVFYSLSDSTDTACVGDFSEVDASGDYRIWNENCGYSYEFTISDNAYRELYENAYTRLEDMECENIEDCCYRISYMMLSSEIYKDSYIDWVYINKQRDELEKYVKSNYFDSEGDIIEDDIKDDSEKLVIAGTLAQFSSLYMDLDEEKALETANLAVSLYESCNDKENTEDRRYFALSYLYRATGNNEYRRILESTTWTEGELIFLADMGYIMSVNPNDYKKCTDMLNSYIEKAKEIAIKHNSRVYFTEDTDNGRIKEELNELSLLGIADYALAGTEYKGIRRDFVRYIGGCNKEALDMITTSEDYRDDIKTMAKIIFVMGY